MTEPKEVKITAAKGRPMLTWVGKRPLRHLNAFPAQHVETFDPTGELSSGGKDGIWQEWPEGYPIGGLLFHGDNKEVLAHLLANGFRGKVNLIYIDPPFDSGADYVRKVQLRGIAGTAKIDGETYTLGEQIQYTDIWANDNYLQFMYERLLLLKELLADDGSIYLHCDWHKSHHLRCIVDEIFGAEFLRNEIIWKRTSARSDSKTYNHIHDMILFITKGESFTWNKIKTPYTKEYIDKYFTQADQKTGKVFQATDLTARGLRNGSTGQSWRGFNPASKGNHWKYTIDNLELLDSQGKIYWPEGGGWPRYKFFLDEAEGLAIQSIWTDLFVLNSQAEERTDFPTQKPEELIERIIQVSTKPGDLVVDCFIGSGTTAAVAQKLGRRWIGCDVNKGAIQTTSKRLQHIISEQIAEAKQEKFVEMGGEQAEPSSAQLAFTTWRVNDYDLAIQHNEAVNLACEHIGVQRTLADGFFDGVLGSRLVKIIPFGHPLSPLDLEEVKKELEARPEEDRCVVLVCLGKEMAADAWLEEWNRLRTGDGAVNRMEVIELRTDPKYGRFITHQPAQAMVNIQRDQDKIKVFIEDFISPTIVERLDIDMPLFKAKITDWRSMVDCVLIDLSYGGQVFNVVLADVPEKKDDLVIGSYVLSAPLEKTTVAVKIIDMLGEEVLVTKQV